MGRSRGLNGSYCEGPILIAVVGFISTYVSKNNNEFNKVGHACNGERVCMNKKD